MWSPGEVLGPRCFHGEAHLGIHPEEVRLEVCLYTGRTDTKADTRAGTRADMGAEVRPEVRQMIGQEVFAEARPGILGLEVHIDLTDLTELITPIEGMMCLSRAIAKSNVAKSKSYTTTLEIRGSVPKSRSRDRGVKHLKMHVFLMFK